MGKATESQIQMFRGIIALAWADHELTEDEQQQLAFFIEKHLYLSAEQRAQLLDEVQHAVKLADIWPSITDKHDRAHLLNIAPVIFQKDGVYCDTEKELYELYEQKHLDSIGAVYVEQEIRLFAEGLAKERRARELHRKAEATPLRLVLQYIGKLVP
jgi:hypothetical protein